MTYESGLAEGHITQVRRTGYSWGPQNEFRVSWKEDKNQQRWEFKKANTLVKATPDNVKKIMEINKMAKQIKELREKMDQISHGLERYTDEELVSRDKPPTVNKS
jgi:hypothetical protein